MSDTHFTFDGERYASLMDFLKTHREFEGATEGYLDDMTRGEEDTLRRAIDAYTEAIAEAQAKADVDAENTELTEAVKVVSDLVEWGDNVAGRTGLDPWENAREFLALPYVKVLRGQLKLRECKDHWHCEYSAADPESHKEDAKADRTKPCPTCKQPESNESFTERCLEALAAMTAVAEERYRMFHGTRYKPTPAILLAQAILAEGRQKGLLPL
jgi:hypothetical protein